MATRGKKEIAADGGAALQRQLDQRTRELSESLEQQAAISDILRVISASPGDVKPVFEAVAKHAARICETEIVDILVAENGSLRHDAYVGAIRTDAGPAKPAPINRDTVAAHARLSTSGPIRSPTCSAPDHDFPLSREYARRLGYRTSLAVPLLREGRALGDDCAPPRGRCARSRTGISRCSRPSRIRPRSRSRTRACSTSCASEPTI